MLKFEQIPNWVLELELEELNFIKKLTLFSGSLKDLAKDYEVTYPTIRIRMDKIIDKLNNAINEKEDPFIEKIKRYAIEEKIEYEAAKSLINEYREMKK